MAKQQVPKDINTGGNPLPRQQFSKAESESLKYVLGEYNIGSDHNKTISNLSQEFNGDLKSALSYLNDEFSIGISDMDKTISNLTSAFDIKKKVPGGLLEMPSEKQPVGAPIPSKKATGIVETQLTSALGTPELAKEALALPSPAEMKAQERTQFQEQISRTNLSLDQDLAAQSKAMADKTAEFSKETGVPVAFGMLTPEAYRNMPTSEQERYGEVTSQERFNIRRINQAKELLSTAQSWVDSDKSKNVFKKFVKGFTDNKKEMVSIGLKSMIETADVANLANKANDNGISSLTKNEQDVLVAYGTMLHAQDLNESFSYSLGDGVAQSIPFMVQMIASAGSLPVIEESIAGMAAKVAANGLSKKMLTTAVGRLVGKTAKSVATAAAKGAAIAAVSPSTVTAIAQEQIGQVEVSPDGQLVDVKTQELLPSIAKGYAKTATEFATEFIGAEFGTFLDEVVGKSKWTSWITKSSQVSNPYLKKLGTNIGYSNFIGDNFGELLGLPINDLIDGKNPLESISNVDNAAQIIAQSLVMGGAMKLTDVGINSSLKAIGKLTSQPVSPEHASEVSKIISQAETPEEASSNLVKYAADNTSDPKEMQSVIGYGIGHIAVNGIKEVNQHYIDNTAVELEEAAQEHIDSPTLETAQDVIEAVRVAEKAVKNNLDLDVDIRAINRTIDNLKPGEILTLADEADEAIVNKDEPLAQAKIAEIATRVNEAKIKPVDEVKPTETIISTTAEIKPEYGAKNKVFTKDIYTQSISDLGKAGKLTSGLDLNNIEQLVNIAGYHIEAGARDFVDFSKRMIDELGEQVKPILGDVWARMQSNPTFELENVTPEQLSQVEEYTQEGIKEPKPTEVIPEEVQIKTPITDEKEADKSPTKTGEEAAVEKPAEGTKQEKEIEDAIQEQRSDESLLRKERPEVELRGVEQRDKEQKKPTQKVSKEEVKLAKAESTVVEQKQVIKELEKGQEKSERNLAKVNEAYTKTSELLSSAKEKAKEAKVEKRATSEARKTAIKSVNEFFKAGKGVIPHSIYKGMLKAVANATPSNIEETIDKVENLMVEVAQVKQLNKIGKMLDKLDTSAGGLLVKLFNKIYQAKTVAGKLARPKGGEWMNAKAKIWVSSIAQNLGDMPPQLLVDLEVVLDGLNRKIPDVTNLRTFIDNYGKFLEEQTSKRMHKTPKSVDDINKLGDKIEELNNMDIALYTPKDFKKAVSVGSAFKKGIEALIQNGSIIQKPNGEFEIALNADGSQVDHLLLASSVGVLNGLVNPYQALGDKVVQVRKELSDNAVEDIKSQIKDFDPQSVSPELRDKMADIFRWINDKSFAPDNIPLTDLENFNEFMYQLNNNGFAATEFGNLYKTFNNNHLATTQKDVVFKALASAINAAMRVNTMGKGTFAALVMGARDAAMANSSRAEYGMLLSKASSFMDEFLNLDAPNLAPYYENFASPRVESVQKSQAKADELKKPLLKAYTDLYNSIVPARLRIKSMVFGHSPIKPRSVEVSLNKIGIVSAALRQYNLLKDQFEKEDDPSLIEMSNHAGQFMGTPELQKKFIGSGHYQYDSSKGGNIYTKKIIVEAYNEVEAAKSKHGTLTVKSLDDVKNILTPEEYKFFEALQEGYASSRGMAETNMMLNGSMYELEEFYMPFQNKEQREGSVSDLEDKWNKFSQIAIPKASSTKYKDPNVLKAIDYDVMNVFNGYIDDQTVNLFMRPEYQAQVTASRLIRNGIRAQETGDNVNHNQNLREFVDANDLDRDMGYKTLIEHKTNWWNTVIYLPTGNGRVKPLRPLALADAVFKNVGMFYLTSIPRLISEPVAQMFRNVGEIGYKTFIPAEVDKWNSFTDLNQEIALTERSIRESGRTPEIHFDNRGITGKAAEWSQSLATRTTVRPYWAAKFNDSYKELTGEAFDIDMYLSDEDFRFEMDSKPEFKKAKILANKSYEQLYVPMNKLSSPKTLFRTTNKNTAQWLGMNNWYAQTLAFLGRYNKNAADYNSLQLKTLTDTGLWNKDAVKAVGKSAATIASTVSYPVINGLMASALILMYGYLFDDDDTVEAEKKSIENKFDNMGTIAMLNTASLFMGGSYNLGKMSMSVVDLALAKMGESKLGAGGIKSDVAVNKFKRSYTEFSKATMKSSIFPSLYDIKDPKEAVAGMIFGNYMAGTNQLSSSFGSLNTAYTNMTSPTTKDGWGAALINGSVQAAALFGGVPFMKDIAAMSKKAMPKKWSNDPDIERSIYTSKLIRDIQRELPVAITEQELMSGYDKLKPEDTLKMFYDNDGFSPDVEGGMSYRDIYRFAQFGSNSRNLGKFDAISKIVSQGISSKKSSKEDQVAVRLDGLLISATVGQIKDKMVFLGAETKDDFLALYKNALTGATPEQVDAIWDKVNQPSKSKRMSIYMPSSKLIQLMIKNKIMSLDEKLLLEKVKRELKTGE